ncbi:MAG: fibronectin type III domain-containing protein [Thermoanaerobaculia bacterium]
MLLLGASACGKKGDPQPPLPRGPRAVSDLSIEQEGAEAVLTFSYPDRLLTGAPLTDLASIEVYRVVGAGPTLAAPVAGSASGARTDEAPAAAARRAAQAARLAEETFYREARSVAALPASSLGEHSLGASVVYRDPLLALLAKGSAPPLAYAVVSVRRNGERSPLSNIAILAPDVPPGAPRIDAITAEEGRICLDWTPPEKDLLGRPAEIGGYFVYRRFPSQEEYDRPLNAAPAAGTSYIDTAVGYGVSYLYTIRGTPPGKPRVEGPPAEEAAIDYRDVYPPPAPARLDALSETNLVRLVWDAVASADVVGYLVFRAEGEQPPVRLTGGPVPDTFYTDPSVPSGRRYRYSVRAVDATGNVGPPSPEAVAEPF